MHADIFTPVKLFAEIVFDDTWAVQHQWWLVLEYEYIDEIDRNIAMVAVPRACEDDGRAQQRVPECCCLC